MIALGITWSCYGLLAVWLCLGSLAFGELLNLWNETSTQDEAALAELASTLKSDAFTLEDRAIRWVTSTVIASICSPSPWGVRNAEDAGLNISPGRRHHQTICIYRI